MKNSALTDVGMHRQSNQDAFMSGQLPSDGYYAVVCDGMGGHAAGNVASKIAVERISGELQKNFRKNMSVNSIKNMLESAIVIANLDVFDEAQANPELAGMGTTAVVAVFSEGMCVIANVGDSRCYLARDGQLIQITKDHSLVQEMVDAGIITEDEAQHHPRKNIITRALGISEETEADFFELSFENDDKLLLCTDGLSNLVENSQMLEIISRSEFEECARKLIDTANSNGGTDNITAVVVAE